MTTVDIPLASDTVLQSSTANTNYDTIAQINVGENNSAVSINRSLIKPDFSLIPVGATITAATLKMTPITDLSSNARTMSAHRVLRTVVYSQATWNVYSTGNGWGTGGCSNSTTDYDGAVLMGSQTQPASPTLNDALSFTMTLDAAEMQKLFDGTYTNNGIVLFVDTQVDDFIQYASTDHATSSYRPVISITYEDGGGGILFFF